MRITKKNDSDERRILIGMIVDESVLGRLRPKWEKPGLFRGRWSNLIGSWCLSYYDHYNRAPGKEIQNRYERWAGNGRADKKSIEMIGDFLQSLSDEWDSLEEEKNSDYVIDIAGKYFTRVRLERLAEGIEDHIVAGEVDKAKETAMRFDPLSLDGDGYGTADQIQMRKIKWLWRGWLALGELTIVDGDPGQGKSQMLLDIAARVTRGWKMPPAPRGEEGPRAGANVIVLTSEDSWEHTVAPRLVCADADLTKVIQPTEPLIRFPEHFLYLERTIRRTNAKLVVIDPIMAFIGKGVDTNVETHVRRCLQLLLEMMDRTGAAVAMIRHLNKKGGGTAIYRGGGSIAWTAQCRLQHTVGTSPKSDAAGTYVLACSKNNLDEKPDALGYRIVGETIPCDKKRLRTSRVEWIGPVDVTANELVASEGSKRGRPEKKGDAVDLIRELLADGKRMDSTELGKRVMSELGIGESTFKKAKKEAGIKIEKSGFGVGGKWVSYLPD